MATDRISVLVKFPRELLAEIDEARGNVPRMQWIIERCGAPKVSLVSEPDETPIEALRKSRLLNDGAITGRQLAPSVRHPLRPDINAAIMAHKLATERSLVKVDYSPPPLCRDGTWDEIRPRPAYGSRLKVKK
jgi:hypothetical protein